MAEIEGGDRKRVKLEQGAPPKVEGEEESIHSLCLKLATALSRGAASSGAAGGGGPNEDVRMEQADEGPKDMADVEAQLQYNQAVPLLKSLLAARSRLPPGERADLDSALDSLMAVLEGVAGRLQKLLERNTPSTVPESCRQEPSVEYARQIITYAHKLSFTTFAPPGWAPGKPLGRFRPPAPQDWQLRASQLHAAARKEEPGKEGAEGPREPPPVAPGQPIATVGNNKEIDLADLPPMPPGWKPGDPLPDLPGLPPMPAGWKPGDELPEIASISTASPLPKRAVEEPQVAPRPSRTLPSAFDFILNPDLEEVEEDYSSDEEEDEDDDE
eukprot:jgi/Botrbrau1/21669/Bobra.43_1s0067.2